MTYTPVKWFDVIVYAAQSVGLFLALMVGIFAGLMIKRAISKRLLEKTGEKKAKSDNYPVRIRPETLLISIRVKNLKKQ